MRAKDLIPVPNIMEMRRVLAFSPHPDDNEVGAGATLARLIEQGAEVHWVVATDGAVGANDAHHQALAVTRRQEQEKAMRILGGHHLRWLGFSDMTLAEQQNLLEARVMATIRELQPDLVMGPDPWLPYESHPDHRSLGYAIALGASMAPFPMVHPESGPAVESPAVAFYGTAWPNTRVDVTKTFDRKLEALKAHESQFPPPQGDLVGFYLRTRAQEWGEEVGVPLAEAFKVLTALHLHFNVDAWLS